MPVLDGSIVQVQLGQRRSVRLRVILPDSPHVLPGRLGADAQARATGLIGIPVAYHRNVRASWAGNLGRCDAAAARPVTIPVGMLYLTDLARVIAARRGWGVIAHKDAGRLQPRGRCRGPYRRPSVVTHLQGRCAPGPGSG